MNSDSLGRGIGNSGLRPKKTFTFAANPKFYATVPEPYRDYYNLFVKEWLAWYDGYVSWFHNDNSGIMSTRLAQTVADKLARQITGGKLLFDDCGHESDETQEFKGKQKNAIDFAQSWTNKYRFVPKMIRGLSWALAAGDSIIKLDSHKGDIYPTILRKDYYFLDTNFQGEIVKFSGHLHTETKQIKDEAGRTHEEDYYIMEERRYNEQDGRPQYRLSIKKGQASKPSYKDVDFQTGDFRFKDLTDGIRSRLVKQFPRVTFNQWEDLPLNHIGVYMLKATEGVSFQPSLPFGESIFSNALELLQAYDYYSSSMMTDQYLGRGKVLLPRGMDGPNEGNRHFDGYDETFMQQIPYANPDEQTPISIQFDLRAEQWRMTRDNILQQLAMKLGINPRDLATFIVPASEKPSAQEISTDENETALWIESKRDINHAEIQALFDTLLDFYEFTNSDIEVKFSQRGLNNMNSLINQTAILKQNNLINDDMAIDRLYPDLNEVQKEKLKEDLKNGNNDSGSQDETTTVEEENENSYRNGINQIPNESE